MEMEILHPYTLMLREDDVLHVSFDAPAYVTLVLDRKNVHTTNRVLGFLAGKEDMDAKSAALAAWRTRERGKSRALHLKLVSPGAKDARPIVIQAEWWDAVLRAPICRSLHFDGTRRTYIHDVLALVPRKHAIECVTFEGVPPAMCLASAPKLRELGVPHLAFVRCGITTVAHLGALLAEEYPDVRALTLREDEDDGAPVDLPAVLGQLIAYFDEHFCLAGSKDAELALLDAELRVDIVCRTAAASDEAFLLPHNLHVTINGVAQDNVDADAAAPAPTNPLDGTLRHSRRRRESSDADDDSSSDGEGELPHAKNSGAPTAKSKGGKSGGKQRPRKKLRLDDAEVDEAEVDDDEPMAGGEKKRDDEGEEGEATDDEDYREDGEAGGDEDGGAGRAAAVASEEESSEAESEAEERDDVLMDKPRPFPGGKVKRPAAGDALADMFGRDAADRIRATDPAFARIMRNAAESAQKAAEGAALVTCVTCHCGVLKREMRDHKRRCRGGARY